MSENEFPTHDKEGRVYCPTMKDYFRAVDRIVKLEAELTSLRTACELNATGYKTYKAKSELLQKRIAELEAEFSKYRETHEAYVKTVTKEKVELETEKKEAEKDYDDKVDLLYAAEQRIASLKGALKHMIWHFWSSECKDCVEANKVLKKEG